MPKTNVVFFAEEDGSVPVLEWISGLPEKVQDKLVARIELLEEKGYELRRPHADILRDGIHELRTRHIKVRYRVLYFFLRQGGRAVTRPHEGGRRSTEGNRLGNQTKGKIPSRSRKAHVPGEVR